jgi:DNA-binding response OmpR family regulator
MMDRSPAEIPMVLLIEDDEGIAEALTLRFQEEGWGVLHAPDGESGLRLSRSEHLDVILLDIMLPDMDGFGVCRILHDETTAPILMLTARDHEMDRVVGLGLGADDYVVKPFGFAELLARIQAVLRRRRMEGELWSVPRLEAADLVLDRLTRQVQRKGQLIELSPREFNLLATLMSRVGQALSRQELLDRVWGETWNGNARTLDVHIRWLREKIEDDAATPRYIETVRGYGYRFVDPRPLAPTASA